MDPKIRDFQDGYRTGMPGNSWESVHGWRMRMEEQQRAAGPGSGTVYVPSRGGSRGGKDLPWLDDWFNGLLSKGAWRAVRVTCAVVGAILAASLMAGVATPTVLLGGGALVGWVLDRIVLATIRLVLMLLYAAVIGAVIYVIWLVLNT